ncbi:hypothetical protein RND81_10G149300 [Saponaria officinalis]|uniref:Uncharacterized protein n=1 Tax=Saponaria officinalis TaxID=3572 RepID=A0AAW1I4N0_SAPOF
MNPKFKPSIFCYSCCTDDDTNNNQRRNDHGGADFENVIQLSDGKNHHNLHVSISTWLKSELPVIKVRCSGIFSGKTGKNRHRGNSAEFRYDPLSYALNFEDDHTRFDELPNFSARLTPSPLPSSEVKKNAVVVSAQIATWS